MKHNIYPNAEQLLGSSRLLWHPVRSTRWFYSTNMNHHPRKLSYRGFHVYIKGPCQSLDWEVEGLKLTHCAGECRLGQPPVHEMCLYYQIVQPGISQQASSWDGRPNCRSGITLVMCHRLVVCPPTGEKATTGRDNRTIAHVHLGAVEWRTSHSRSKRSKRPLNIGSLVLLRLTVMLQHIVNYVAAWFIFCSTTVKTTPKWHKICRERRYTVMACSLTFSPQNSKFQLQHNCHTKFKKYYYYYYYCHNHIYNLV